MHRLQASFDGLASSIPAARHAVERALTLWGLEDLVWPAALLVSELTANALLHARTAFTVSLWVLPSGGARLEVSDGSPRAPRMRHYGDEATTGRGLRLVEELATRWGVDPARDGKTVWVELAGGVLRDPAPDDDEEPTDVEALLLAFPDLEDGGSHPTLACAA